MPGMHGLMEHLAELVNPGSDSRMSISVVISDKKKIKLDVFPWMSIAKLKARIQAEPGIPQEKQQKFALELQSENKELQDLEDDKPVSYYVKPKLVEDGKKDNAQSTKPGKDNKKPNKSAKGAAKPTADEKGAENATEGAEVKAVMKAIFTPDRKQILEDIIYIDVIQGLVSKVITLLTKDELKDESKDESKDELKNKSEEETKNKSKPKCAGAILPYLRAMVAQVVSDNFKQRSLDM
jgi:hypothetical protein